MLGHATTATGTWFNMAWMLLALLCQVLSLQFKLSASSVYTRNKSLICSKRFALYSLGSLLLLHSLPWVTFTPGDAHRDLADSFLIYGHWWCSTGCQGNRDQLMEHQRRLPWWHHTQCKDSGLQLKTVGISFPPPHSSEAVSYVQVGFFLLPVIFRLTGRVSRNFGSTLCLLTGKEYFQQRHHRFQAPQLNEKV